MATIYKAKKLYEKHENSNDHIVIKEPRIYRRDFDTMYDINRVSSKISAVFLNFIVFNHMKMSKTPIPVTLSVIISQLFIFYTLRSTVTADYVMNSIIIIAIVFLVCPILTTLVDEISDDTIYLFFIFLSIIFILDATRCAIYNDYEPPVELTDKPLKIECVDMFLRNQRHNTPILGYNAIYMSCILLISRLNDVYSAFLLQCFTFFWYFIIDHCSRSSRTPVEFVLSGMMFVIVCGMSYYTLPMLLYVYAATQIFLFGFSFLIVFLLSKYSHR